MGTPLMSEVTWNKVIGWLGKHVQELAEISCEQVCQKIVTCGEKFSWLASYDLRTPPTQTILLISYMMWHQTRYGTVQP